MWIKPILLITFVENFTQPIYICYIFVYIYKYSNGNSNAARAIKTNVAFFLLATFALAP